MWGLGQQPALRSLLNLIYGLIFIFFLFLSLLFLSFCIVMSFYGPVIICFIMYLTVLWFILEPFCKLKCKNRDLNKAHKIHFNEKQQTSQSTIKGILALHCWLHIQKTMFCFISSHRKACMVTISLSYQNESILNLCKKKKNAAAQEQQPG